jgi:hypothetical protein
MQHGLHGAIADARTQAALQVVGAEKTPGFLPELMRDRSELTRRFTACYIELRALPRRVRRALQRQWRLPLAGVALMLVLGQEPAEAATIQVGPKCTLVDAITAANTDRATGGCPAGQRADRIVLPAGSTQNLSTALPTINSAITIVGRGSTIRRAPGALGEFRLIGVNAAGKLTLQGTTLSGALFGGSGGGIANVGGTVAITNSTISNNYVSGYYGGGGIFNDESGTMVITNSTISDNRHDDPAGGILNRGTMIISSSTIVGNATTSNGGGVQNFGTLTVVNSTISGNDAESLGGGVFNGGTLTVLNSTITGNRAGYDEYGSGGGIYNAAPRTDGSPNVNHPAGTLRLAHTIIAGNTAGVAGPEIANSGNVFAQHHNLFGVDGDAGIEGLNPRISDVVPAPGVLLSDILNPNLANNGGPTQTHALVPSSPAIDAGVRTCVDTNGAPLRTDQRGRPRRVDGDDDGIARCDIGAFEFSPVEDASAGPSP